MMHLVDVVGECAQAAHFRHHESENNIAKIILNLRRVEFEKSDAEFWIGGNFACWKEWRRMT